MKFFCCKYLGVGRKSPYITKKAYSGKLNYCPFCGYKLSMLNIIEEDNQK